MAKALHRVLVTFGTADNGRLGLGFPLKSQLYPRIVGSLAGYEVKQVSCGGAHTAVVTDDGTLFTFGLNTSGQLGHSKEDKYVAAPIEVGLPDPVKAVAAGGRHTLALTTAGEVWAFGSAGEGALGIGTPERERQVEPRLVKHLSDLGIVSLAAGDAHSVALSGVGECYTWGRGENGALGHGAVGGHVGVEWSPRRVRALLGRRLVGVAAGPFSSGAVERDGSAHVWGAGTCWQLGTGSARDELTPVKLTSLPGDVESLSLGQQHSLFVLADGRVFVSGSDSHGTLGSGQELLRQRVARGPVRVEGLAGPAAAAAVGWRHCLVAGREGRLWAWGWSGAAGAGVFADYGGGQLGLGDDTDRWSPEQVLRLHTSTHRFYDLRASYVAAAPWRVRAVSAGRNHSAALVETPLDVRDLVDG